MSRFKMALAAMVAVFAIGAVGASAASAASGTATVTAGTTSCGATFNYTASPSTTPPVTGQVVELTDLATVAPCDVTVNDGGGELTLSGTGSGSTDASLDGEVVVDNPLGSWTDCAYSGTLTGTWNAGVDVTGTVNKDSGLVCPSSETVTIDNVSF
jgi:hypothetical protein